MGFPRVLQTTGAERSEEALCAYLRSHGPAVASLVRAHGAVLIRGFEVRGARGFSRAMRAASPALRPMADVFLAEDGRARVAGEACCLQTNAFKRTGGYLRQEVVPHAENYYSTDVPEIVGFFCEEAPRSGGETGLFCAVRTLALLPRALSEKLASERFDAQLFCSGAELARACGLPRGAGADELGRAAAARGVASCAPVRSMPSTLELRIRKPSIVVGPGVRRSRRALCINAAELGAVGLAALAHELERRVYSQRPGWWLHRQLWRCVRALPPLGRVLSWVEGCSVALRAPVAWLRFAGRARTRAAAAARSSGVRADGSARTLRAALRLHEAEAIGRALGRSVSLFSWRAGDILLVDNLTVLHDGMPGRPWEARSLVAMLFNPVEGYAEYAAGRVGHRVRRSPGVLDIGGAC